MFEDDFDFESYTPTPEESALAELLTKMRGNIAATARAKQCSRRSIYRRVENSPFLKAVIDDAREVLLDDAENALARHVEEGNITAIIFVLKTLGKRRGYTQKSEMDVSGKIMTVADIAMAAAKEEEELRKRELEFSEFEN